MEPGSLKWTWWACPYWSNELCQSWSDWKDSTMSSRPELKCKRRKGDSKDVSTSKFSFNLQFQTKIKPTSTSFSGRPLRPPVLLSWRSHNHQPRRSLSTWCSDPVMASAPTQQKTALTMGRSEMYLSLIWTHRITYNTKELCHRWSQMRKSKIKDTSLDSGV